VLRGISWIALFEPSQETIHKSTLNTTKNTAETQRTQRKRREKIRRSYLPLTAFVSHVIVM
jgi:hypothetical protein